MHWEPIAEEYEREGVIRVRGFLSGDQLEEVKTAIARYIREVLPGVPPADRTYEADSVSVRNMWRMERHDEYFASLAKRPFIQELVGRLLHGEPVLMGVETFNKPARTGSAVPWHQDNAYFCQSPPDVLTVWIAIDAATIENGAVYYARGSQHTLWPHVPSGVAGNSMGLKEAPAVAPEEQFCGELKPGDVLLHHCQIMHRSAPNASEYSRLGLLMVFRAAHTQTDPQLKERYDLAPTAA